MPLIEFTCFKKTIQAYNNPSIEHDILEMGYFIIIIFVWAHIATQKEKHSSIKNNSIS